eukprot:6584842-Pyramimonas_sp.AAC.1
MADPAAEACGGDLSGAASRVMVCPQMERRRHVDPAIGASGGAPYGAAERCGGAGTEKREKRGEG